MSRETRYNMARKLILETLIKNKDGLTFSELIAKVKFSKEDVLDALNELLNYTPLVGIQGEKYFFRG